MNTELPLLLVGWDTPAGAVTAAFGTTTVAEPEPAVAAPTIACNVSAL